MEKEQQIAEASTRTCMGCQKDIFTDKKFLTVLLPHRQPQYRLVVYGMCCEDIAKAFYKSEKLKNKNVDIGMHFRKAKGA